MPAPVTVTVVSPLEITHTLPGDGPIRSLTLAQPFVRSVPGFSGDRLRHDDGAITALDSRDAGAFHGVNPAADNSRHCARH